MTDKVSFVALRHNSKEFCEAEVELRQRKGKWELSICGTAGLVASPTEARRYAREFWESYFEDSPEQIHDMNGRMGTNFRSPYSAAKFVLLCDGEYHGADVHCEVGGRRPRVLMTHSSGQIREELEEWFPELQPFFEWHLNGMQVHCAHLRGQGLTYRENSGATCIECKGEIGKQWYAHELPMDVVLALGEVKAHIETEGGYYRDSLPKPITDA